MVQCAIRISTAQGDQILALETVSKRGEVVLQLVFVFVKLIPYLHLVKLGVRPLLFTGGTITESRVRQD